MFRVYQNLSCSLKRIEQKVLHTLNDSWLMFYVNDAVEGSVRQPSVKNGNTFKG